FQRFSEGGFGALCFVYLINRHELFGQKWLNAIQIVICVCPFRPCALNTLLCTCHISPGLIHCGCQSSDVGFRTANVCLRNRDCAYQSRNFSPLIADLALESGLLRNGSFKSICVWSLIDFKQQLAFLHKLVVMHIQSNQWTLYLRRDSN